MGRIRKPRPLADSSLHQVAGGIGLPEGPGVRAPVEELRAPEQPPHLPDELRAPPIHFDDTFGLDRQGAVALREKARLKQADLPKTPSSEPTTKAQAKDYLDTLGESMKNLKVKDEKNPLQLRTALIATLNDVQNTAIGLLDLKDASDGDINKLSSQAQSLMSAIAARLAEVDEIKEVSQNLDARFGPRPSQPAPMLRPPVILARPSIQQTLLQSQMENQLVSVAPSTLSAPHQELQLSALAAKKALLSTALAIAKQKGNGFSFKPPEGYQTLNLHNLGNAEVAQLPKEVINSIYKQAALLVHTDKGGSREAFQELAEAFQNYNKASLAVVKGGLLEAPTPLLAITHQETPTVSIERPLGAPDTEAVQAEPTPNVETNASASVPEPTQVLQQAAQTIVADQGGQNINLSLAKQQLEALRSLPQSPEVAKNTSQLRNVIKQTQIREAVRSDETLRSELAALLEKRESAKRSNKDERTKRLELGNFDLRFGAYVRKIKKLVAEHGIRDPNVMGKTTEEQLAYVQAMLKRLGQ